MIKHLFAGTSGISWYRRPTGLGGWHKFVGGTGIVIPTALTVIEDLLGQTAEIRWNNPTVILEVYDGSSGYSRGWRYSRC